jgi:hypothetical protein
MAVRVRFIILIGAVACARAGSNVPGTDAPPGGQDGSADIDAPPEMHHDAFEFLDAPMMSGTHLVINEVDYDNPSTDTTEYVEIFNPSSGSIDLTNVVVMFVSGSTNMVYRTEPLSSIGTLGPGEYLVISDAAVTVPTGAKHYIPSAADWGSNAIQNASSSADGIALVDTQAKTVIDALSYGGSITAAQLTNFTGTTSLVEGTATTATDSPNTGALCRKPNGQDTDNASVDWAFCSTLSPGAANP